MEIFAGVVLITVGILLFLSTLQQFITRNFVPQEARNMHNGILVFSVILTISYYLSLLIVL